MKKTIFSLFIAALVAVVMTSCGKKNEIPAGVKINQEVYSVTVPEGWSYDVTRRLSAHLQRNSKRLKRRQLIFPAKPRPGTMRIIPEKTRRDMQGRIRRFRKTA